ncbi:MAG TPA: hypothetical protein VL048_05905 [Xanthobacteraceae bacterium]|nr:hypothetical protein [Xanthobacteraceae bacterium]
MPINVDDGILMALREAGSSDAQIADAKLVLGSLCRMEGTNCVLVETGAPLESDKSMEWLRANKPHLLPVNHADADKAFAGTGNKTAAARLIRDLGKAEADRIAQTYGKAHALDNKPGIAPHQKQQKDCKPNDHKGNPWSSAGWSVTKQGQLVRSLGLEKASAMARAVNSHIGATRPSM